MLRNKSIVVLWYSFCRTNCGQRKFRFLITFATIFDIEKRFKLFRICFPGFGELLHHTVLKNILSVFQKTINYWYFHSSIERFFGNLSSNRFVNASLQRIYVEKVSVYRNTRRSEQCHPVSRNHFVYNTETLHVLSINWL